LARLTIASATAHVPRSWSDATIIRESALSSFTPPGCVQRALDWSQHIPDMPVNNQSLVDVLRYNGTSLWWFIHTLVFSSTKHAILTIERTARLLENEAPDEVLILGLGPDGDLMGQVCRREGVHCALAPTTTLFRNRLSDRMKVLLGRALQFSKEIRRKRVSERTKPPILSEPHVLFLSPSANWRSVWNYELGRYERRDVFMGRIMREVHRQGCGITAVDVDYSLNGQVGLLKEKVLNDEIRWVPFERYLTSGINKMMRKNPEYGRLPQSYELLEKSELFKRSLTYDSISLWRFMQSRFRRALSSLYVIQYSRLIEAAREMIRTEQPNVVAMSYETGPYARATIVAAWEMSVPTVGVQHGFITPDSAEYMHRHTARSMSEVGCPIPTKTVLSGEYSVEMLTQRSSYPGDGVLVTGYAKHDDLADLKHDQSRLNRAQLLTEIGLNPNQKTVMIASGGFHAKYGWSNPEYDREVLSGLLDVLAVRPDIQLLVRLHPIEDGEMQRGLVKERQARVAIVKGERNDLLWSSDMLVTVNSVVSLDALVLDKPVMMMEHTEGEEIPMVDLGNAPYFYNLKNLRDRFVDAISQTELSQEKRQQMRSQVARHANSVDGRASFRIASLLRELAEKQGSS
jgi:hypothetical protein